MVRDPILQARRAGLLERARECFPKKHSKHVLHGIDLMLIVGKTTTVGFKCKCGTKLFVTEEDAR